MAGVQNKIDAVKVDQLIENVLQKKKQMLERVDNCTKKMVDLQNVYRSDASTQYQKSLNRIATEVNEAVDAIVKSLKENAIRMVQDYQAQDKKIAESTDFSVTQ
ncbi:MAG: hypothetical protein IKE70_03945 [Bacilli bacterium]|nr:hypothetical protein [Bacilli bacterium]